jgi:phage terminase large subunit
VCRFPQKTVCTAPTSKQLFDALYAETVTWLKRLKPGVRDLFEIKSESIELIAAPEESFVSFRTSSADKPEALAGVHSQGYVLLVCDEASGIPDVIFESAAGSMSGFNATTILTGNPVRRTGFFYDVFNNGDLAPMWVRSHVSCVGHPNVDQDFIRDIAARYGESSNAYRVRVLGEFSLVEDDVVIPWELIDPALARDVKPLMVRPIWGLDVARQGRDANALAKRQGNVLTDKTKEWHSHDTMITVGKVKSEWDGTLPSQRPSEINVDVIGIGAGVVDRLRELGLPARGVNVSESASMQDRFRNLRSELWWKGREWFEKKDCCIGGDEDLAKELSRPTFEYTSNGKILVEPKKMTMKRTSKPSPNKADAFLLTLASENITASGGDQMPTSWKNPLQRLIKGIV